MKLLALLCLLFIGSSLAVRSQWVQLDRANPDSKITVRFALTQYNLDVLESTLLDRSNPKSANYGQWLSKPAILDIVAPSMEVSESVAKFLRNAGALKVENQRDVIKVFATVSFVEQLLQTTLHEFSHVVKTTRVIIRAVGGYQIPTEIEEHVDFVSGLFEFPSINKRQIQKVSEHDASVDGVDGYIVPYTIQNLYQIPASFPVNINSSICLAEFQDDASYNKADLKNFAKENAIPNINVTHVVGPYSGGSPDAESTLDVQYGGAISINTSVWFWTVDGWMYEFATDFYAATSYPLIVSMSWGWPEPDQCQVGNCTNGETSFQYVSRVNVEFQKIGLNGVTLLAASGDQGAPGDGNPDCTGSGKKALSTIFPGASPWVVSVGATMLTNNSADASDDAAAPPICKQFTCSTSTTEEVCTYPEALITTGGGFSNYVPTPSYQASAVSGYLNSKVALPPKGDFNASNRGFPDVSALGHNYLIDLSGQFIQVDGTSCSSPVFAAVIALINSARFNAGKSSIGFALPFLYGAPSSAYTDITSGNNKCTESCCSKIGYVATTGWDPVTGLGSPIFPKLLSYALSLP